MNIIYNNIYKILLVVLILLFIIYKITFLNLPFYWDEAWVYGPAVRIMAQNHISLLPNALPIEVYRGHPLLFHVSNAIWIRIFGDTLVSMHSFSLLISCLLIVVTYLFGKKFFSEPVGFAASLILCLQPIFLAQSTLILPEVMLALFSLLTLYFFLSKKYLWYVVFASFTLLTKETGITVILLCCLLTIIFEWHLIKKNLLNLILKLFFISSPLLPLLIFLFIQYKIQGWFLFPEHIGLITYDFASFWKKFYEGYSAYLFIFQGRNFLFFSALLVLIIQLIRKQRIENMEILLSLLLMILIYLIVSALNFFSNRYILCLIPIFILITVSITFNLLNKWYYAALYLCLFSVTQLQYINSRTNSDHNLGFANAVKTNQSMVQYCLSNGIKDKSITANFNTRVILTNSLAGYVKKSEVFTKVGGKMQDSEYYIISNYDTNDQYLNFRSRKDLILIKRFECEQAWIEIYNKKKKPDNLLKKQIL